MTKFVVIRTDGRTEFTTLEAAQTYFNSITNAVSIDTVEEQQEISYPEKEVACWQFRAVMEMAGHKQTIDNYIASLPENERVIALTVWEYGNNISTGSLLMKGIKDALTLTNTQVHDYLTQAEKLTA